MSKKPEGPGRMMVGNPLTLGNLLEYLKDQTQYEREVIKRELEMLAELKVIEGYDLPWMVKNCAVKAKYDTHKGLRELEARLEESITIILAKYFAKLIMDELEREVRRGKLVEPDAIKNLTFT